MRRMFGLGVEQRSPSPKACLSIFSGVLSLLLQIQSKGCKLQVRHGFCSRNCYEACERVQSGRASLDSKCKSTTDLQIE